MQKSLERICLDFFGCGSSLLFSIPKKIPMAFDMFSSFFHWPKLPTPHRRRPACRAGPQVESDVLRESQKLTVGADSEGSIVRRLLA